MSNGQVLRVLMVSNRAQAMGGAHAAFRRMTELLSGNNVDVRQFTLDDILPSDEIDRSPGVGDIGSYLFNRTASARIRELLQAFKPDLAHVHLFVGGLSSSILLELARARIPIFHTAHDYRLICPANAMLDNKGQICERCKSGVWNCVVHRCSRGSISNSLVATGEALVRRALGVKSLIDRYIFVSKFSQEKYAEFDSEYKQKGIVIPNFLPAPAEASRGPESRRGFLYFGRLSEEKGLKNLLVAFAKTSIPLTLVGDGPLAATVAEAAKGSNNIIFLGPKSYPELGEIISGARFCIVPSVWYENNPLAVIEAFALGTPVLASNIGGLPEMVRPGQNGDLFKYDCPSDLRRALAVADCLSHEQWQALSDGALRSFRDNYSEQAFLDKILSEYRAVLSPDRHLLV